MTIVKLVRCTLCGVFIGRWRTLCFTCETAISEGWPDVDDEPTLPGV